MLEQAFEARKEYARQVLEYVSLHQRHLKDYGQMCLRTVFLLNGESIIVLLGFIGTSAGRSVGQTVIAPAA